MNEPFPEPKPEPIPHARVLMQYLTEAIADLPPKERNRILRRTIEKAEQLLDDLEAP